MSFKPTDFLSIAEDLVKDKDYDHAAGYRTIIGRAYYGCFLYARDGLGLQNWQPTKDKKRGEIHREVITLLKSKDSTRGDFLSKLRWKRNNADYNLNLIIDKNDAIYAIKLAKKITANPV